MKAETSRFVPELLPPDEQALPVNGIGNLGCVDLISFPVSLFIKSVEFHQRKGLLDCLLLQLIFLRLVLDLACEVIESDAWNFAVTGVKLHKLASQLPWIQVIGRTQVDGCGVKVK